MTDTIEQLRKLASRDLTDLNNLGNASYNYACAETETARIALSIIEKLQAESESTARCYAITNKSWRVLLEKLKIATACLELFASTGHVDAISTLKELSDDK